MKTPVPTSWTALLADDRRVPVTLTYEASSERWWATFLGPDGREHRGYRYTAKEALEWASFALPYEHAWSPGSKRPFVCWENAEGGPAEMPSRAEPEKPVVRVEEPAPVTTPEIPLSKKELRARAAKRKAAGTFSLAPSHQSPPPAGSEWIALLANEKQATVKVSPLANGCWAQYTGPNGELFGVRGESTQDALVRLDETLVNGTPPVIVLSWRRGGEEPMEPVRTLCPSPTTKEPHWNCQCCKKALTTRYDGIAIRGDLIELDTRDLLLYVLGEDTPETIALCWACLDLISGRLAPNPAATNPHPKPSQRELRAKTQARAARARK